MATTRPTIRPTIRKASFAADFARFGPHAEPSLTLTESQAYTRGLAASHYENFPVLTRVLPRAMRQPIADVYAFSRWADDLGDEVESADDSLALLDWWQAELDRCYDGDTSHPVFRALRSTIETHDVPKQPFADLIAAFRQDQTVTAYDTAEQVADYCRRSANPVGRLVLHLASAATEANVADSDAICTGLQLANFCQDVGRDAAIGRRYLPLEELDRFGVDAAELSGSTSSSAFRELLASEVAQAEALLRGGRELPRRLPFRVGLTVDLFRRGGLAICRRIRGCEFRVLEARPTVGKRDAVAALGAAVASRAYPRVGGRT